MDNSVMKQSNFVALTDPLGQRGPGPTGSKGTVTKARLAPTGNQLLSISTISFLARLTEFEQFSGNFFFLSKKVFCS